MPWFVKQDREAPGQSQLSLFGPIRAAFACACFCLREGGLKAAA
jgi:hypothetical protein